MRVVKISIFSLGAPPLVFKGGSWVFFSWVLGAPGSFFEPGSWGFFSSLATSKNTFAPVLFPIQFRCIAMTRSGQPPSSSCRSPSNSSEYAVVFKNHCSISRASTRVSSCRQQNPPFTTCSFASTVQHFGHQFTRLFFLYASPFSSMRRKNHWFQR